MIKSEKTLLVYAIVGLVFGAVLLVFGQPMGWLLLVGGLGQFGFISYLVRKRQQAEVAPVEPAGTAAQAGPVAPGASAVPEAPAASIAPAVSVTPTASVTPGASAAAGPDVADAPGAPTPR